MSKCLFPTCSRHAEKNGYCIFHRIYANGVAVKMPKEVNKVSDDRKQVNAELKKLYPLFLKKYPRCRIRSPECTGKATAIHHRKGRGKNEILDSSTWLASCERCNLWVETHDSEAREKGFKISKFQKQLN